MLAILSALMLFAALRIATGLLADRMAASDPERALRWRHDHPIALLAQAQRELANAQSQASTATARHLLAVEPLQGKAFGLIAVSASHGDQARTLELHRIAVRHAPRDSRTRVWLINHYLQNARYVEALHQIDTLLHVAPAYRDQLYPVLAQMADQPTFASALARTLHARPTWRAGFMEMLQNEGGRTGSRRVLGAISRSGGMQQEEFHRWIEVLLGQQRWGEAYSRWAGSHLADGAPLHAIYNGDFSRPTSNSGFDWRVLTIPGVELDFSPAAGTSGPAAHAYFPGRPVAKVNLEQPLFLAPGSYRLTARMRARSLDGEYGLEWTVVCGDRSPLLGNSPRVLGSFDWREIHTDFTVPATGCPGQWLQLVNPAPGGAAQRLSGEVWFDDVAIHKFGNVAPGRVPVATLRVEQGAGMRSEGASFVSVRSGARMVDGERLMLSKDAAASITYDNGCTQNYAEAGVYWIDQTACAAGDASPATAGGVDKTIDHRVMGDGSAPAPVITVLPDGNQDMLPIGR